MRVNYKKLTVNIFKEICSRGKYEFEPELDASVVYEEIKRRFKIGDKKIEKHLEKYRIEEGNKITYKNPYIFEIVLNLPYYFTDPPGIIPPASIECKGSLQKEYGCTLEMVSKRIEKIHKKRIPPDVLLSWIRERYSGKIRKGPEGYWYTRP